MPAPFAIMAEFDTPAAILSAAEKVHGNGYRQWDVFTPFPIHGMDRRWASRTRRSAGFRLSAVARVTPPAC